MTNERLPPPNTAGNGVDHGAPFAGGRETFTDDPYAPERLRLSADFGTGGVKKIITTVLVRKPDRHWFVRVRPGEDWRLAVGTIEIKEDRETYLVDPALAVALSSDVVPKMLFTGVARHGVPFLWPIRLPGEDGKLNEWHRSALEAAHRGETCWVRIVANMALGAYEIFEATAALPEPDWPDLTFSQLLEIAFRDRLIRTMDHPVLRRLRGEV